VAVARRGKSAACTNPRCADNGVIRPAHLFDSERVTVRPDRHELARRVVLDGGGVRIMPAACCE
jgi:hypothetical protein